VSSGTLSVYTTQEKQSSFNRNQLKIVPKEKGLSRHKLSALIRFRLIQDSFVGFEDAFLKVALTTTNMEIQIVCPWLKIHQFPSVILISSLCPQTILKSNRRSINDYSEFHIGSLSL
jgi:hypothetical protein